MAFNRHTFKTRTITAAIFVVVMLVGLLWNRWSFFVLFSIIHFGCWWEYLRLIEKIHQTRFHHYLKFGLMMMGYGLMIWFCGPAYQINGYGLKENLSLPFSAAGFALLILGIFQKTRIAIKSFGAVLFGIIYISLCWGLMIDLYAISISPVHTDDVTNIRINNTMYVLSPYFYALVIIGSIWINDTMAYIAGSFVGRTPISKISPQKTWEGTIGGIVFSVAVMFLIAKFLLKQDALEMYLALIALIASIAGTFGDLFESKLKRKAGVKDSGHIMPGHGGFLDRFDSLLFAIPFVWLYVYFFMR